MQDEFTLAITGDSIINRRISVRREDKFLSLIKIIRDADVGFTHLESVIHDYDGPEVYPAAEGGNTWMRSPRFAAEELKWAGFDVVSHAGNHSLDYSYGGLFSTWQALDNAGLSHAGTGKTLADAREAAYLDTGKGRVALISMCSSFTGWARAGEARRDVKGRPGLNPLRYYYEVDAETLAMLKKLAVKLGWWVTKVDNAWVFNAAGTHMATYRFVESKKHGVTTKVDEDDAEGNLRSISDARRRADWVFVHLHTHEWDAEKDLSVPDKFVTSYARTCIDAGADAFIAEGSHSLLKGIEIYKHKPIFYDPGDFLQMPYTVTRLPTDYYMRPGFSAEAKSAQATAADGFDARDELPKPLNPPGGYFSAKVIGCVVAVCAFNGDATLSGIKLYPFTFSNGSRRNFGLPLQAEGKKARDIIKYLGELSAPFGTKIAFKEGIGYVKA